MNENEYMTTPFEEMGRYWRESLRRPFWVILAVFLGLCLLFGAVYASDEEAALEALDMFMESKEGILLDAEAESRVDKMRKESTDELLTWDDVWGEFGIDTDIFKPEMPKIDASALFWNNAMAGGVSVLLGFIPFLFLVFWSVFLNASVIGAAAGAMLALGQPAEVLLAGLLPHGIFEITALALCFAMGFALCKAITKRIFRRPTRPLWCIKQTVLIFVVFVLPLLLVAAVVESYVTPELMLMAMGW